MLLTLALVVALSNSPSIAPVPARHAIVIAAPTGDAGDAPLAYAERDAAQMADVLREVGGFAPSDVEVLLQPSRAALDAAFMRQQNSLHDNDFLVVYYSGHGDAFGMHLGDEHVAWRELLAWTTLSHAQTRLLVVDACNSGALTRLKGGRRVAPFMPNISESDRHQTLPQGLAILTSSGASEYSIESAAFSASLFTHHLVAALSGAADRNNDGAVSLSEAYEYTTERLNTAQASFDRHHQHPSFRYSLRGETDLWLSHIQPASHDAGVFQLSQAGTYVWQSSEDRPALEVTVPAGQQRRIEVPAGNYTLSWRHGPDVAQKPIDVEPGTIYSINSDSFAAPLSSVAVANKGGSAPGDHSLDLQGGLASPLVPHATVQARGVGTYAQRLWLGSPLVWDASLELERSEVHAPALPSTLLLGGATVGLRMTHAPTSWLNLSYGLRAGAIILWQSGGTTGHQAAPTAAAVLRAEVPLYDAFFIVAEVQERVTALRIEDKPTVSDYRLQTVGTLGIGLRF